MAIEEQTANTYVLLKKGLRTPLEPCQLRCGKIRFKRGTKLKVDQSADFQARFADRAELGKKIAEQLYLSDLFPELNEACHNHAWHEKPLSNFATIGITDVAEMDCHCATMLSVHSSDADVKKLCGGINEAAQRMICFKKHKPYWAIYGNCLLVSYDTTLLRDTEMRHEYLPISRTSLDNLTCKFKFLKPPSVMLFPTKRADDSGGDVSFEVPPAPNPSILTDWIEPALVGQQPASIEPCEASQIVDGIEATWRASVQLPAEPIHEPEDILHTEMETETIYVITFTRNPKEFEQCLHDGYELEPLRVFALTKGQSCRLEQGGSIFVHPEQYLQVRAQITIMGLRLGPSNVVVSETYKQLVYGAVSRLRSRLNVKPKGESPLAQVTAGSEPLSGFFFGESAKEVIIVSNTFLSSTPHAMRMAQSVTQSTGEVHSAVHPRRWQPRSSNESSR
mmetsp:Transcript_116550/g.206100  ORF Transcript_116550/g.206100 Transcript_116550/m.206100 type:complete len:450 (+) Transcript_116550:93-1442(+)